MITANELRIGNLYDQFGYITKVSCNTLKELEASPIGQLWCKPIPLTEEWLMKFGVKALRKGLFDFVKVEDSVGFHVYFIGTHLKETQHVHQLQNLFFALTGEELTLSE